MSDQTKLGVLLTSVESRDAVHVAVAPVVADEQLAPGAHVGFTRDGDSQRVGVRTQQLLGVVDPFLTGFVNIGERFWLFLYPQTITSLRHNWTHPAFTNVVVIERSKAESERWLKDWCARNDGPSYELIMGAVNNGGSFFESGGYDGVKIDGDYLTSYGTSAYGDIPSEFWDHVEVVVGRRLAQRPSRFSCSC